MLGYFYWINATVVRHLSSFPMNNAACVTHPSNLQYLTLFYLAIAYVAVLVGLFVWALLCFIRNSWPVLWPLKALRAMGGLSATTLFIPLFYLLMSGFNCGDGVS